MKEKVLITGFGGFIGTNLVSRLAEHFTIIGMDNFGVAAFEPHYKKRLQFLNIRFEKDSGHFNPAGTEHHFYKADILNEDRLEAIIAEHQPKAIIHLAALTGVRQSFDDPKAYINNNIQGTSNIFQAAKKSGIKHVLYASSSSVYGQTKADSFSEDLPMSMPLSIYGATKITNELFAQTYFHAFGMSTAGLRFFTVYGPWNRPDMAAYGFTKNIDEGQPIRLFNDGNMMRDFTYVGDIVNAIEQLLTKWITGEIKIEGAQMYNIGGGETISVIDFVRQLETSLGKKALIENAPNQKGDMPYTKAATEKLFNLIRYKPQTTVKQGIEALTNWYKAYKD